MRGSVDIGGVEHVRGVTFHRRRGGPTNAFRYGVDYLILDAERPVSGIWPFRRNVGAPVAILDRDHGGPLGEGRGAVWVRERLAEVLPDLVASRIELLAQPRVLGHVFNPVAFWLIYDADNALAAVIAEVTNTYGDRHSYLCHRDDLDPITADDRLTARKVFHVSPFQPVAGNYTFVFDITAASVAIRIELDHGAGGLVATLTGERRPLTRTGLLGAMLRRPLGARRVLTLIHWQALKLWWSGARFLHRPEPPATDLSK